VITGATQRELARQVKYLKIDDPLLQSKLPAQITVTPKERQQLLKFGSKLGKAIRKLMTIVAPSTFLRWIPDDKRSKQQVSRVE
jgi:putative transposase